MKKLAALSAVIVGAGLLSATPFSLRFSPELNGDAYSRSAKTVHPRLAAMGEIR
jgi:hypothetical protein